MNPVSSCELVVDFRLSDPSFLRLGLKDSSLSISNYSVKRNRFLHANVGSIWIPQPGHTEFRRMPEGIIHSALFQRGKTSANFSNIAWYFLKWLGRRKLSGIVSDPVWSTGICRHLQPGFGFHLDDSEPVQADCRWTRHQVTNP